MSENTDLKNVMDEQMAYVFNGVQKIIIDMNDHKEKYRNHHTTLYWTGIKMSNNRTIYRDEDIKILERLCSYSGEMITYAEEMEKIATDIHEDVCQIKSKMEDEIYLPDKIWNLNDKLNILILLERQYVKEQEEYGKYIQFVNQLVGKCDKPSVIGKLKHKIKNYKIEKFRQKNSSK